MSASTVSTDPPSLRPTPKRTGSDWWPTPAKERSALRAVLHFEPGLAGPVWEMCAGDGVLLDAIRREGRDAMGTDLEPRRADIAQHDFLTDQTPAAARGRIAISNPPFNRLDAFMQRGWSLMRSGDIAGSVLLVRMDALFASTRASVLSGATSIWIMPWRTRWIPDSDGNPRWSFAWVVWTAQQRGPPTMRWLEFKSRRTNGV